MMHRTVQFPSPTTQNVQSNTWLWQINRLKSCDREHSDGLESLTLACDHRAKQKAPAEPHLVSVRCTVNPSPIIAFLIHKGTPTASAVNRHNQHSTRNHDHSTGISSESCCSHSAFLLIDSKVCGLITLLCFCVLETGIRYNVCSVQESFWFIRFVAVAAHKSAITILLRRSRN